MKTRELTEYLWKKRARSLRSARYIKLHEPVAVLEYTYRMGKGVWVKQHLDPGVYRVWTDKSRHWNRHWTREDYLQLILQCMTPASGAAGRVGQRTIRIAPKKYRNFVWSGRAKEIELLPKPKSVKLNRHWTLRFIPEAGGVVGCTTFSRETLQETFEALGEHLGYEVEK